MKNYNKELDNFEYNKRFRLYSEHKWDFLKNKSERADFEKKEHESQKIEVAEGVFKDLRELLIPAKGDVKQSSPEITGQHNALPAE